MTEKPIAAARRELDALKKAQEIVRGALLALFGPRAPEIAHIQRWLLALLEGPLPEGADHLHAAWFSTTGAGFLFPPATFAAGAGRGWSYIEIGSRRED